MEQPQGLFKAWGRLRASDRWELLAAANFATAQKAADDYRMNNFQSGIQGEQDEVVPETTLEPCDLAKPYRLRIVWGEERLRENVKEYRFATLAEREAFMDGVEEGETWRDHNYYFDDEEPECADDADDDEAAAVRKENADLDATRS